MATFDDKGRQIPDPRPVEAPVRMNVLTIQDEIRRFVRQELSQRAREHELETFEESDDFEVEDEDDVPLSGFEVRELMPEPGDQDADPPSDPKARAPAKPAAGGVGESGGEPSPLPDEVQVEANPLPKS